MPRNNKCNQGGDTRNSTLQSKFCRICFEELKENSFSRLFFKVDLCPKCLRSISPKFIQFKINGVKALAFTTYDSVLKQLLYQYKGQGDYELNRVFLNVWNKILHLIYHGYIIIPIPSNIDEDKLRGFNHVEEIYKNFDLMIENVLYKEVKFKQAASSKSQRKDNVKHLKIKSSSLQGKKILIVDDVMTTGSTIVRAVELIRQLQPKKIKVFVLALNKLSNID